MAFQSRRSHPRRSSLLRWTIFLSFVAVFIVFFLNSQVTTWSKPLKPQILKPENIKTISVRKEEVVTISEENEKAEEESSSVNQVQEELYKEATATNTETEESEDETETPEEPVEEETQVAVPKFEEVGPRRKVIEPMSEAVVPTSEESGIGDDTVTGIDNSGDAKGEAYPPKSDELSPKTKASSPSSENSELQGETLAPNIEATNSDDEKLMPLDEAAAVSSAGDESETLAIAPESYPSVDEELMQAPPLSGPLTEPDDSDVTVKVLDSDNFFSDTDEVPPEKATEADSLERTVIQNPAMPKEAIAPTEAKESVTLTETKEAVAPAEEVETLSSAKMKEQIASAEIREAMPSTEAKEEVVLPEVKETVPSIEVEKTNSLPQAKYDSGEVSKKQSEAVVERKNILSKQESQPNPKIAMLFLTRDALPHEPSWRAFFEAAGRLSLRYPAPSLDHLDSISGKLLQKFKKINNSKQRRLSQLENHLNSTACKAAEKLIKKEVKRLMTKAKNPSSVIAGQTLFSVYVHPRPKYTFPESSIFHGKEIKERTDTSASWGTFRLVKAELLLLAEALKDPMNKKFILLSESCIPLYPPEVVYAQLMSEKKSRMMSCNYQADRQLSRYTNQMEGKFFHRSNWRKSSQWFALNRAHVEVLLNETYVKTRFKKYCNGSHGRRFCVSDEHYIPSALNAFGLGNQTDCNGAVTFKKFTGGAHPVTFYAKSIQTSLFLALRHKKVCNAGTARTTATALFDGIPRDGACLRRNYTSIHAYDKNDQSDDWVIQRGYVPMNSSCPLFARKFASNAVEKTLETCLSCTGGSLGYWC